jgi:hypothetical protein
MDLKVKLPTVIQAENKGAVNLIRKEYENTTYQVRINSVKESKESGIITTIWISRMRTCADISTKNLPGKVFEQHLEVYCRSNGSDSNLITKINFLAN